MRVKMIIGGGALLGGRSPEGGSMGNKILDGYRRKYGVSIMDDSFIDRSGRFRKCYRVYSADGCRWDCGLSWKSLRAMFKADGPALMAIKMSVVKRRPWPGRPI